MKVAGEIWLVRVPTHDRRWLLWPPHLLERIASALMFARVPTRLIDAAVRPISPQRLAEATKNRTTLNVVFWSDELDRKAVSRWIKAVREQNEDLPVAVVGPCGEATLFFQAGANLVLQGEADGAPLMLIEIDPELHIERFASPLLNSDEWPLPAREHLPPEVYYDLTAPVAHPPITVVEAARSNPHRQRSVEAVAGELAFLSGTTGNGSAIVLADDFAQDRNWLSQLARCLADRRQTTDLLVQVKPDDHSEDLARELRWCRVVHVTLDVGELHDPAIAEHTCRSLVQAGLMTRISIDASLPPPLLRAARFVARRGGAHDLMFPGSGRRIDTIRARKRYLQSPITLTRNLWMASTRRPAWWLDAARMLSPLVSRN